MFEDSDSSDDDVCFGPYTIKEAKRDWRKYPGKKVDRRHSTACVTSSKPKVPDAIPALLHQVQEISVTSSNSKCPSEYLTPNETMSSETSSQSSEFLDKLKQVIDEPSHASSYATALDQTSNRDRADTTNLDSMYVTLVENTRCFEDLENDGNEKNKQTNEESVITISDESQSLSGTFLSEVEPEKSLDESSSPQVISAISSSASSHDENEAGQSSLRLTSGLTRISLSEPEQKPRDYSCNIISGDSLESFEDKCEAVRATDLETNPMKYSCDMHTEGSLLIPREQDDYSEETEVYSNNLLSPHTNNRYSPKEQNDYSEETDVYSNSLSPNSNNRYGRKKQDNYSEETDVYSNNLLSPHSNNRYGKIIVDCNQLSKISERTEFNSCIDGSVEFQQRLPLQSEADSNSYESMSRQNSEINQEESHCLQYDIFTNSTASSPVQEPAKKDDSLQFDDTLEEITNFLAQGENYVMPEVTPSKYTPDSKQRASEIISASFLNKSTTPSDKLEYKKNNFKSPFESKIKPPSVVSSRLFTKPADNFKVPIKPLKKMTTPSKLNTSPCLKNVVSPVGVYIKNSPKYCPLLKTNKTKITPQKTSKKAIGANKTPMKENIPSTSNMELPMVIYRPAKNQHTIDDERLKLPENIKKLVGAQSVIKHEERIQNADCNESIERRLMESDFSIDASGCNDISILTNKQPFKT